MSEFSIAEENKKCPTPEQMPVNAPIIGHPLGGGTGTQTQIGMGTYKWMWTLNWTLEVGEMRGLVSKSIAPWGNTGDFKN